MRLSVVLGFAACFLLPVQSQAAWDIFQSYVIIDSGSGDQYLAGGLNADGASAFGGTDLGDFTATDALTLNGGELKTYKNGSSNVCGGTLNYRVYALGDTPGAFTALDLPFSANLSGSDQKWAATGQAVDLLDALAAGDYVLELYWEADGNDSNPSGCGETQYDSDSGNNFAATFSVVQSSSCVSPTYQGYTYDVIQIGDQCWFAENLKATSFNNGDLIPLRETNGQWNGNTTPIRRRPGNSDANFDLYGYHYSGWTMTDARNVCPVGWHIPTKNDWMTLMVEAGAPAEDTLNLSHLQTIGTQELTGQKLRGTSAGGTDDFGFNALMGGRSHGAGQGTKDLHVKGTWFFDMQDPNSTNVGGGEYFRIEMTTSTNHVQIARNRRKYGTTLRCMLDAPAVAAATPGCMDPDYTEYDADATTDDGSCVTLIDPCENALVLGSIEVDLSTTTLTAEDGSASLTVTTGTPTSLTLSGINGAPDYTIAQPATIDGIAAGSYTVTASDANGCMSNALMLIMPYSLCCDCGVSDIDTDGICDDIDNCTNRSAANHNDPANGTCVFYGCTNTAAANYDASANTDDGSCIIYGCTDAAYMEYDATANTDDGSCATLIVAGCTDPAADNYDATANVEDGSCLYYGCTDAAYMEYDATANTDDGSCTTLIVEGCTEPGADNYNAAANSDDGSCIISGCTDPAFEEYNPDANNDDGSCSTAAFCSPVEMDGVTYGAVEIGDQCWTTTNLRTTVYADGTPIPNVTDDNEWTTTSTGGQSVYLNDGCTNPTNANCLLWYGRLYNHHAVTNAAGLCPTGWHVPTDADWTELTDFVASEGYTGNEGTALKGTESYHWHNGQGNGTDIYGFTAVGQGYRKPDGSWSFTGAQFGMMWSSTPNGTSAWSRIFRYNWTHIVRAPQPPNQGNYVRCIKDALD